MKWEYYMMRRAIMYIPGSRQGLEVEEIEGTMRELGQKGWELVSTTPVSTKEGTTQDVYFIFKRSFPTH
jgi:hypothetical protein